jgi:hypothetical protein
VTARHCPCVLDRPRFLVEKPPTLRRESRLDSAFDRPALIDHLVTEPSLGASCSGARSWGQCVDSRSQGSPGCHFRSTGAFSIRATEAVEGAVLMAQMSAVEPARDVGNETDSADLEDAYRRGWQHHLDAEGRDRSWVGEQNDPCGPTWEGCFLVAQEEWNSWGKQPRRWLVVVDFRVSARCH